MIILNSRKMSPFVPCMEPQAAGAMGSDDTFDLFKFLLATQNNCIYRINGQCWSGCEARTFCGPQGLEEVEDVPKV